MAYSRRNRGHEKRVPCIVGSLGLDLKSYILIVIMNYCLLQISNTSVNS